MAEQPSYVQAQGGGFAPAFQPQDVVAPEPSAVGTIGKGVSAFLGKLIESKEAEAYTTGMLDNMAGAITKQSWLTQEAYEKGVNFSKFSGQMNAATDTAKRIAIQSAKDGDTTEAYGQKLKEFMLPMVQELKSLNLDKDSAHNYLQQMWAIPANALAAYEKQRQEDFKMRVALEQASVINTSMNMISENGWSTQSITSALLAGISTLQSQVVPGADPTKVTEDMVEVLGSKLNLLSMADESHRGYLINVRNALDNPELQDKLSTEARKAIDTVVNSKFGQARTAVGHDLETRFVQTYLDVTSGTKLITYDAVNTINAQLREMAQKNLIDPEKQIELSKKYADLFVAQQARLEKAKSPVEIPKSEYNAVARAAMEVSNADGSKSALAEAALLYGDKPDAIPKIVGALLQYGRDKQNPTAYSTAGQFLFTHVGPLLSMDPAELKKHGPTDAQRDAWSTLVRTMQSTPVNLKMSILDGVDNAQLKNAIDVYINTKNSIAGRNTTADVLAINDLIATAKSTGSLKGNVWSEKVAIEPKHIESDTFGRLFGNNTGAGYDNVTEETAQSRADTLNAHLQKVFPDLVVSNNGVAPGTVPGLIALGLQKGMLLQTNRGVMPWHPAIAKNLPYRLQGQKQVLYPDTATVGRAMDSLLMNHAKNYKIGIEDVSFIVNEQTGLVTLFSVDSDGIPKNLRPVGPSVIREELASLHKSERTTQEEKANNAVRQTLKTKSKKSPTGIPMYDMPVTGAWANVGFGVLGFKLAETLFNFEGFIVDWKVTLSDKDKKNPNIRQVHVIGLGASEEHGNWKAKLSAARGDPKKMSELMPHFAKDFYKNHWTHIKSTGITKEHLKDPRFTDTIMASAYAHWHGGPGGAMKYASVINLARKDKNKAIDAMKDMAFYKRAGVDAKKYLEHSIITTPSSTNTYSRSENSTYPPVDPLYK